MRAHRPLTFLAAAAVCAALLSAAPPSTATPLAPAAGHADAHGCVPAGEKGLYLSKEGEAKLTYSQQFLDALARAGITAEAVAPHTSVDGGTAVHIPIGEEYDNIELPSGRVCYPGGMTFRNPATGASYTVDTFWIKFEAFGDSKVFTTPEINGSTRAAGELNLANFTVSQALTTAEFVPHNGGIGPKRVTFTVDPELADDLNTTLGTDIAPNNTPWATLDIAWKGAPTRPLPDLDAPELSGLKLIADAIQSPPGRLPSPVPPPGSPRLPLGG
jgi:hypothetical protein